ncbi:ATP phosphoribosyltransferase [Taibaiella koreensis]|uniref:ATP phosphoribosyltransferase n=1 Tax=Taibaiella koreensis TaxID=1268548 RepID=UPI000E59C84A|nr:ATP phosphoribosyltransferase [Taibaiella koreensis]
MCTLKLAIQKNGRLSEQSLELLKTCGIRLANGDRKLRATATNFPLEVLFLRDDDIPQYVEQGVADIGILGENEVLEKARNVATLDRLSFAACRLSLAIPREESYTGLRYFNNKRIATSYPRILGAFLKEQQIVAEIEEIGGSVEIAPGIGLADGICDIVSTGSTLLMNGLKEVETILRSEAVLIATPGIGPGPAAILEQLRFRIRAVHNAATHKYILLNAPDAALAEISTLIPGMKSPTILPLAREGWSSIHSVVREDIFWEVTGQLKKAGAEGILVIPIEKMIL